MSEVVKMPALGESVTEGTVTRWLKAVGDQVAVDEPLLEVSTDKVDTEIPSPVAGTLQQILAQEDDTVPVGADLAVIGEGAAPAEQAPAAAAPEPETVPEPEPAPAPEPEPAPAPAPEPAPAAEPELVAPASSDDAGTTVTMPALGESVTEGTVTRWLRAEGDTVAVDEPLLEVSTDKVDTEIPSPVAGVLTRIIAGEDSTVAVGGALAVVGGALPTPAPARPAPAAPAAEPVAAEPPTPPVASAPPTPPAPPAQPALSPQSEPEHAAEPKPVSPASEDGQPGHGDRDAAAYVTPLVRKLAADHGIDLGAVSGTGVGGRIRKQDVLAAADAARAAAQAAAAPAQPASAAPAADTAAGAPPAASPSAPAADSRRGTTQPMSRLRKMIARRMVESLQVSAQLTSVVEVDVTKIARLRDRSKADFEAREGTKLSFLPFFALAAVEALKAHPTVNASIDGDDVIYHGVEHVGVAVDTDKGLIVPVVKNAGDLNIAGLAKAIADVAERTRTNRITPDDLAGGTFTLTNTGSRGALFDTPIINQPQVAILGTGAVVKRPVVVKDKDGGETIAIRSMVYLALSYDHRIVDGADAARFLSTMKARLEEGAFDL